MMQKLNINILNKMSYQNLDLDQSSEYDMIIVRNRSLNTSITCEITSSTGTTAFDFSTYTGAVLQVKVRTDSSTAVLEFNTVDGSILLGVDGKFSLVKTSAELQVRAGDYFYDMYLISPVQTKRAFLKGGFKIIQNITD